MLSDGGSHGSAHRLRFDSSTDGDGGTHGWAHRLCEESLGGSHGSAHRLLWPHRLLFGGEADIVGDIVGVNGTNMGAFAEKVGVEAARSGLSSSTWYTWYTAMCQAVTCFRAHNWIYTNGQTSRNPGRT